MHDLLPLTVSVTFIVAVAWVIGLIIGAVKQRGELRARTDFYNRILDKFSSADEFSAYLQSDAGRSLFENLNKEQAAPISKIWSSFQKGAVLSLLGIGLLLLTTAFRWDDGGNALILAGTIALTVGVGFLISAIVFYRLAKTWGLISADDKSAAREPIPSQP